jgi:hypothetical protein
MTVGRATGGRSDDVRLTPSEGERSLATITGEPTSAAAAPWMGPRDADPPLPRRQVLTGVSGALTGAMISVFVLPSAAQASSGGSDLEGGDAQGPGGGSATAALTLNVDDDDRDGEVVVSFSEG